eukprot:9227926-Heterocapsa_arctica.AAC.1
MAAGRKRSLTLLFGDDPTWKGATGPILHWAKLVWTAATANNFCHWPGNMPSLGQLASLWRN